MTEPLPEAVPTFREDALKTVDQLHAAITDDQLDTVLDLVKILNDNLSSWIQIQVKESLDKALEGDLLLFNVEEGQRRLDQWQRAVNDADDVDLTAYRSRVEARTKDKKADLQVRGISSHCGELWQRAVDLEHGANPPSPAGVLDAYYVKAYEIAHTALAEIPGNVNLEALVAQAAQYVNEKRTADTVYPLALAEDRYAESMEALESLTAVALVPRYAYPPGGGDEGAESLQFERMISLKDARKEIIEMGSYWGEARAEEMRKTAEKHLADYQPNHALIALETRAQVERFVDDKVNDALTALAAQAETDARKLEQADLQARQAQRMAEENPESAWDLFVEAYQTYAGAPMLDVAREAVVNGMAANLGGFISRAEGALGTRDIEGVVQIYTEAETIYGGKDDQLDELLHQLGDVREQAEAYANYIEPAREMQGQLRELVQTDAEAAGELLNELEQYPEAVLADLGGLPALRAEVRERLGREGIYRQLYGLLRAQDVAEVAGAIEEASGYSDEARFKQLATWLEIHQSFLNGKQALADGNVDDARELLGEVTEQDGHPDQQKAVSLLEQAGSAAAPAAAAEPVPAEAAKSETEPEAGDDGEDVVEDDDEGGEGATY